MKNILYLTLLEVGEPLHSERKGLKSTLNDLCETDRIFPSRDQIRPREFHVHFSTCLRNARGHLCLHLPNPSNVCFIHGNVEGGSLHHKKYETFAGETDMEREGETAVSAIAPHGHAGWRKPLDQ